jgi:multimeric flavodoxin WrbA
MKTKTITAPNRILGVVGSPRKNGNTHILVSRILDGAEKRGTTTEIIFLNDLNIRECDGCHICWKGKQCSKKDDMHEVYPKIIQSDVIIFGTPVYWYGPTALMKCFIDRFVYFNCPPNRAKIRGKSAVIAVPFEENNPQTARLLVKFFEKSLKYLEMNLIGKILVPGVSRRGDILRKEGRLEEAFKLGIRLARYCRGM